MHPLPAALEAGAPYPLGATFDGLGVNFAVFSAHAEAIELCLYDPSGRREIARYPLPEVTDEVFHGYLPDARPGLLYGLRAHGPYAPEAGHRFNPNKLLLDPYARALSGTVRWTDALCGYRVGSSRADLSFDRRDSGPAMPKAVVTSDAFDWTGDVRPNTPWDRTVIYEAHVKGLTRLLNDVIPSERGTYAALSHPRVIEHLHRIGATAIELLPIHGFVQDRYLQQKGLVNYWGYNSIAFFAPEARYMATGSADELRMSIRRLHAAGIEVFLDVVYNHTAEGSELGPTLSFRGLDNATYYRLQDADPRYCVNDTGTGNTMDLSHPRVLQMVADSLRFWTESFRVDGFRFDLGCTLGRDGNHGFNPKAGFFDVLRQDPVLNRVKLISEPWDIGPGGYQLGNHPPGFGEWNDKFRDVTRSYWRGDPSRRPEFASRLSGSADLFDTRARRPWASINFVTAHDGFTLADLVSYERKHNDANAEDNRDGSDDNRSCNWGVEGPSDDPAIQALRGRVARSMLTTLMMALGTPMILAGDEFGRTQNGNNNAYCQDNETSWIDWMLATTPEGHSLSDYVRRLTAIRRHYPLVRSGRFLHGRYEVADGVVDLDWFDERGLHLSPADWNNPDGKALAMRRVRRREDGALEVVTMLMNGSHLPIVFSLPSPALERFLVIDSADPQTPERAVGDTIEVQDRSVVVLVGGDAADAPLAAAPATAEEDGAASGAERAAAKHWGARIVAPGRVRFRLWAPARETVTLEIEGREPIDMRRDRDGWFESEQPAEPGARYRYVIDETIVPDPASRLQSEGVHGWSVVIDPDAYAWRHTEWRGRPWAETILWECHPGVLGGYAGVAAKLPELADLGVTAIELMPLAEVPGSRNWGYDGVLPYAPTTNYGTPDELKALIDRAHGLGIQVFLDVVYNHFGPDGNYLPLYAPTFFDEGKHTPWGGAVDPKKPAVAEFFIGNALMWLEEYRFDGLRFDAVQAIRNNGFLDRMAQTIRATLPADRQIHLVLENENNDADRLAEGKYDAQWNDDFHNILHVMLTDESDAYYGDFADRVEERLARCLGEGFIYQGDPSPNHDGAPRGTPSGHLPPTRFVSFLQNHDQVGNRAMGERLIALTDPARLRAATALHLLCPQTPMLFMGEETGSRSPFLFFTDFHDELADAVREGRRKEFAKFAAFQSEDAREKIPDPNAVSTFARSRPEPGPDAEAWRDLYRRLIALRAERIAPHLAEARNLGAVPVGAKAVSARWSLGAAGTLTVAINLGDAPVTLSPPEGVPLHVTGQLDGATLAPASFAAWLS